MVRQAKARSVAHNQSSPSHRPETIATAAMERIVTNDKDFTTGPRCNMRYAMVRRDAGQWNRPPPESIVPDEPAGRGGPGRTVSRLNDMLDAVGGQSVFRREDGPAPGIVEPIQELAGGRIVGMRLDCQTEDDRPDENELAQDAPHGARADGEHERSRRMHRHGLARWNVISAGVARTEASILSHDESKDKIHCAAAAATADSRESRRQDATLRSSRRRERRCWRRN